MWLSLAKFPTEKNPIFSGHSVLKGDSKYRVCGPLPNQTADITENTHADEERERERERSKSAEELSSRRPRRVSARGNSTIAKLWHEGVKEDGLKRKESGVSMGTGGGVEVRMNEKRWI